MSEFGTCAHCPEDALVKLNGQPLCIEHFNAAMARLGDAVQMACGKLTT